MSKTFDRYTSILFLIIGTAFVTESNGISKSAYGSSVGPDIFPKILGVILIFLSLRLFYETFRYTVQNGSKQKVDYLRFFIIFIAAVFYAIFLESLGYVITTFLFLVIGFQVMQRGGWVKTLLISGAFSLGVYYLFVEVLKGSLPGFPTWFS
jgi:putative tricarboxylic transport membrane protein